MTTITVLTLVDRIACFHSLYPFFTNTDTRYRFIYTDDPSWCLEKDTNTILVMMRQFIKPDVVDLDLMRRLRAKYQRIAFFHDDAGGGIPRLEVLPLVDLFYTKALFRDRSLYGKQLYGKELYSNYFHEKYGVIDPDARTYAVETNEDQLSKLRLSWNIGVGQYPRKKWRQRMGYLVARKLGPSAARFFYQKTTFPTNAVKRNTGKYPVHARLGLISRPSIMYMRKLIIDKIVDNPLFLTGQTSQRKFNKETAHSKIVLSPFGWGELCLRDFEAVRSGALLLKPDMSHLETWPDIFIPEQTYVPCDWEANDIEEKANYYLTNEPAREKIALEALRVYKSQLNGLQERFSSIIKEICGPNV